MSASAFAIIACVLTILTTLGCASRTDDQATQFIAEMDARPADEQVPDWPEIRALMKRPAPKVGQMAPDFALQKRDGKEIVRLSDLRGSKPVVLIFGSWT